MAGLGIHRDAVRPRIGNGDDEFQRVFIKDQNLIATRNVKLAVGVIRINIVRAAGSHDIGGIDNRVRFHARSCLGESARSEGGQTTQNQQAGESRKVCFHVHNFLSDISRLPGWLRTSQPR